MGNNTAQQQPEPQVPLLLTISEVNMVINSLSELPYKYSAVLIPKIRSQAEKSLAEQDFFVTNTDALGGNLDPATES